MRTVLTLTFIASPVLGHGNLGIIRKTTSLDDTVTLSQQDSSALGLDTHALTTRRLRPRSYLTKKALCCGGPVLDLFRTILQARQRSTATSFHLLNGILQDSQLVRTISPRSPHVRVDCETMCAPFWRLLSGAVTLSRFSGDVFCSTRPLRMRLPESATEWSPTSRAWPKRRLLLVASMTLHGWLSASSPALSCHSVIRFGALARGLLVIHSIRRSRAVGGQPGPLLSRFVLVLCGIQRVIRTHGDENCSGPPCCHTHSSLLSKESGSHTRSPLESSDRFGCSQSTARPSRPPGPSHVRIRSPWRSCFSARLLGTAADQSRWSPDNCRSCLSLRSDLFRKLGSEPSYRLRL